MRVRGLALDLGDQEAGFNIQFPPSGRLSRQVSRQFLRILLRYVLCIESLLGFGLFNTTVVALLSHKIINIQLHQPLSKTGVFFATPCLFFFDFVTLWILYRLLAASRLLIRVAGSVVAIVLTICSAAFASMYVQG